MSKLNTTTGKTNTADLRKRTLRISTTASQFNDRYYTKERIIKEMQSLKDIDEARQEDVEKILQFKIPSDTESKDEIIHALITLRKKMFKKYPGLHKELSKDLNVELIREQMS